MALIPCITCHNLFLTWANFHSFYLILMISHFPLFPLGADGRREGPFNPLPAINESSNRSLPSIKVVSFNFLLLSDNIKKFPTSSEATSLSSTFRRMLKYPGYKHLSTAPN
jgi:hypothetical protein